MTCFPRLWRVAQSLAAALMFVGCVSSARPVPSERYDPLEGLEAGAPLVQSHREDDALGRPWWDRGRRSSRSRCTGAHCTETSATPTPTELGPAQPNPGFGYTTGGSLIRTD